MCTFGDFPQVHNWIDEQTRATTTALFPFVPKKKSSNMSPAEEDWEVLPEESQAGELGGGVF